jgi:hypothetical protein
MANLGEVFDATTVEPLGAYEALPAGKYLAQIVSSEMRVTKDGMGKYLFLEVDLLEGKYTGRKLFDRLNLVNSNEKAVELARRTLSSICHATGVEKVKDSSQFHLVPFIADVKVRPAKGQYDESNSIRYLPRANPGAQQQQVRQTQQPLHVSAPTQPASVPVNAVAANSMPWHNQAQQA